MSDMDLEAKDQHNEKKFHLLMENHYVILYKRSISEKTEAIVCRPKHNKGYLVLFIHDAFHGRFVSMRLKSWRKLVKFMLSKDFYFKPRHLTMWEKIKLNFAEERDMPTAERVNKKQVKKERLQREIKQIQKDLDREQVILNSKLNKKINQLTKLEEDEVIPDPTGEPIRKGVDDE